MARRSSTCCWEMSVPGFVEYETAGAYYEPRTLTINPEYAHAHVGRADTVFQASRGTCTPDTADAGGLESAAARFDEALQAAFRPALSDIEPKVAFGLGRVHLCQMLAGLPEQPDSADFQAVVEEFEAVVEEYEAGNDRLDEAGDGVARQPGFGLYLVCRWPRRSASVCR